VLGEDGVDGISWDLDHSSHAHALYQGMLASLADLGVLIGVASKNDPNLVEQAMRRKDLLLPANSIFPVEAGWSAKSESVHRILKAWNIAADSVMFIDDSPMEIAEVTAAFPEILGMVFPTSDERAIGDLLESLRDLFGKPQVLEEDSLRLGSLRDVYRRAAMAPTASTDDLLLHAEAKIALSWNQPDQRAFELINKTNQFNLNGRRIDESAWKTRTADPRCFLVSVSYKDKYGPLGKIAVVSGLLERPEPLVDIWVMSCRALSRRIEHQVLQALFEHLDVESLVLDVVPTDRNWPLREFVKAISGKDTEKAVQIRRSVFLSRCPPLFAELSVEPPLSRNGRIPL